jgi:hypothetical protein
MEVIGLQNMTQRQFRDALAKGLGRAKGYVRCHRPRDVRPHLLHACLHDVSYDPISEPTRAPWLLDMADISGEPDFYHQRILAALAGTRADRDLDQLFRLASRMARRGDPKAKAAIYERLARLKSHFCWERCDAILAMDGLKGLVHLAEALGVQTLAGRTDEYANDACDDACYRFGRKRVAEALRKQAKHSANVRAWFEKVQAHLNEPSEVSRHPDALPPMKQVLAAFAGGTDTMLMSVYGGLLCSYGNARQLRQFYETIFTEKRSEMRLRRLRVFWHGPPLPAFHPRLFKWAQSEDVRLRRHAIGALGGVADPRVRAFALRLLHDESLPWRWDALALLIRNYVTGDFGWIRPMLPARAIAEVRHTIGMGLRNLAGEHRDAGLAGALEWMYEHTPCSFCRETAVREIIRRRCAPAELLQECLDDSNEETRARAQRALRRVAHGRESTGKKASSVALSRRTVTATDRPGESAF